MTKLLLLAACLISTLALVTAARQNGPATREAAPPTTFDKYHFVVLVTGDHPPEMTDQERAAMMRQHIGHLTKMGEEGYCLVAGPFGDHFDERWRGLCLYRGDLTADEVRQLAEADPAVKAGAMKVELMSWYTSAGALAFPMAEDLRKKAGH